jgi:8-oxo-dGTP diphosphatase
MELLKTIRDKDLGLATPEPSEWKRREAARAVVFDVQNNVALLHATKKHFHKLPGGGLEDGEDPTTALRREIREEIGCEIDDPQDLGTVDEYRAKYGVYQTSYCYTARVVGEKGRPSLMEDEIEDGFETVWMSLEDAINTLAGESTVDHYEGKFIVVRDLFILRRVGK